MALFLKVERIKLSHDHMEYGTGLHVKEVEVDVPSYGNHYTFPCNCWLAQDRLMEMTAKDLNSSTPTPSESAKNSNIPVLSNNNLVTVL